MSNRSALVVGAFLVLAVSGLALPPEADAGLVAYWPFDNNGLDLTGNGNNATLYNGATYDLSGHSGQALSLDGTNDYAMAPDSPTLRVGAYTVSAWVRPVNTGDETWTGIVGKPGRNYNMWLGDSNTAAGFIHHRWHDAGGTNSGIDRTDSVPMNAWTHIVITNNGTTGQTYINGVPLGSAGVNGALIVDNTNVYFGTTLDGGANGAWFRGSIDDVAIWNEALPAATIQGLANGTVRPTNWLNMPKARLVPGTVGSIMGAAYAQNGSTGQLLGPVTWQIHRMDPTLSPLAAAYVVPFQQSGNQQHTGALGMEFDVNQPIIISQLGVFDDDSDGLTRTLSVRLYSRAAPGTPLAALTFSPGEGTLIGGSRFKLLNTPLSLPAGFQGMIVADGYGPGEDNGNWMIGGSPPWTTDSGGGVLSFVGRGWWDGAAGVYPGNEDGGPANRYAAGTFLYQFQSFSVGELLAEGTGNIGSDTVDAWFFSLGNAPGPQYLQLSVEYEGATAYSYAWVTGTPEPATCVLLAAGLLALARRRRRQPPLA